MHDGAAALCDTEVVEFDSTKFGAANPNLKLLVNKVKDKPTENRKCLLYIHGGGAVMLSA